MENKGIKLAQNFTAVGKKKSYRGWEIPFKEISGISGKGVLCIACYVTLPFQHTFYFHRYFKEVSSISQVDLKHIIYSFIIIKVKDKAAAEQCWQDLVAGLHYTLKEMR